MVQISVIADLNWIERIGLVFTVTWTETLIASNLSQKHGLIRVFSFWVFTWLKLSNPKSFPSERERCTHSDIIVKEHNQREELDVVADHEKGDLWEGNEEAFKDLGDGGEGGGEVDRLGGVEGGDNEDNGGGREEGEGEGEEEEEVAELEGEEKGPLMAGLGRVGGRVLEAVEEGMIEEGVGRNGEGEREDGS